MPDPASEQQTAWVRFVDNNRIIWPEHGPGEGDSHSFGSGTAGRDAGPSRRGARCRQVRRGEPVLPGYGVNRP